MYQVADSRGGQSREQGMGQGVEGARKEQESRPGTMELEQGSR